jgi:hypothetical protein
VQRLRAVALLALRPLTLSGAVRVVTALWTLLAVAVLGTAIWIAVKLGADDPFADDAPGDCWPSRPMCDHALDFEESHGGERTHAR